MGKSGSIFLNQKDDDFKQFRNQVAKLESRVDMLESELSYLNSLLVEVGFPGGIDGLKHAIEDVLDSPEE